MKFILLLLLFSSMAVADSFEFKKNVSPIKKHSKICLDQTIAKHKAMFYRSELCDFGKEGCEGISNIKPLEVFCDLDRVTDCYSMKAWKSRNQYFNLSPAKEVSNISHQVKFVDGHKVESLCAHYK